MGGPLPGAPQLQRRRLPNVVDLRKSSYENLPPLVGGIKGGGEHSNKV